MSSVPKGWSRLGGASRISGWVASGSYGASTSAKIAVVTSRTRSAADASPSGFRLMTAQSASPRLAVAVGWRSKGATRTVTVDMEDSDRKSTRLNSSHGYISYAVFCLKKKKKNRESQTHKEYI